MKDVKIKPISVKFQGKVLKIDIQKELSINENLMNSQLKDSPSSYYILCAIRDKYIKERDALAREKEDTYASQWVYFKDSNERWNNEYVTNKVLSSKKYNSVCERYLEAATKASEFISICQAYQNRENILRTLNANIRKQL